MEKRRRVAWSSCLVVALSAAALSSVLFAGGCADERWPGAARGGTDGRDGGGDPSAAGASCEGARSAEPLPARDEVVSSEVVAGDRQVFVADLFNLFKSSCGGCHVEAGLGSFQVGPLDFADKVDAKVVERILTTDASKVMPPPNAGGALPTQRKPGDPVTELASLLGAWIGAGRPRDVFYLPRAADAGAGTYIFSLEVGDGLTNIGSCVPTRALVGSEKERSARLDDFFAKLERTPGRGTPAERVGLPEKLADTDLFTFDSATLARHGVIAYAPAYPLWSDGSRKLRHIRVPRGTTVVFDKAAQTFAIPPNTRFYKTFFKKVVDLNGVDRYRKIETRVIVARPDAVKPDGTAQPTALFGTYAWNDEETEATLVTDPLRNAEPFRDRLITYVTDERAAQAVADSSPKNLQYALEDAKAIRRYAIPGSERCVQCHMGSPTGDFALGFLPVQLRRRADGEGGVIEPIGADELTQLERLIDYGVVTGMTSPEDVTLLEDTQLPRKPRNVFELRAQGYVLGNCAHCHNPRGYPSVTIPAIAKLLDFLPRKEGGIFEFPLDRVSPRITRGIGGAVKIPYVTPSLLDFPSNVDTAFWTPKWDLGDGKAPSYVLFAPWRSLIYRNVDSPFTYADDLALFPHMPMHTAGFDCRAPRVLAEWMVTIPAKRKSPEIPEDAVRVDGQTVGGKSGLPTDKVDENDQPYVEVRPGEADFDLAKKEADARLATYRNGGRAAKTLPRAISRYAYCPDTSDVVDPEVLRDPKKRPVPADSARGVIQGDNPPMVVMYPDGVPDRAHWVVSDLTEVRGDWTPRRPDWEDVFARDKFPDVTVTGPEREVALARQAKEKEVVRMLRGIGLSAALRTFATTEAPFGLWVKKVGCDFAGVPTVASVPADRRPRWIAEARPALPPDGAIYATSPGEAVFTMICANCHGPRADSAGRQAENLMTMTGGDARVANLRDGLFGPTAQPAQNRARVFGKATDGPEVAAARYLGWMALGGTARTIPPSILAIVGNTDVLGVPRPLAPPKDANMLATAKELCGNVLAPATPTNVLDFRPELGGYERLRPLIWDNGDAELWLNLCAIDNPPPVRAIYVNWDAETVELKVRASYALGSAFDLYPSDTYPFNEPVGNDRGGVEIGVRATNLTPWCLRRPLDAATLAKARRYAAEHPVNGKPLPLCPEIVVPRSGSAPAAGDRHLGGADMDRWATRGAINAGLAVFLYLDHLAKGAPPRARYDQCELRNK